VPKTMVEFAANEQQGLTLEHCWELVERVAASQQFKRSARLREFLLYVGRRSLIEHSDEIHQRDIRLAVFGRDDSYDTSVDDNIVRVNASEMRKRIEVYFESEGADEPVIFEVPRGSYTPVFRLRTVETEQVSSSVVDKAFESPEQPRPIPELVVKEVPRRFPISWLLVAVLTIITTALWVQSRAMHNYLFAWKSSPALASFWSNFLESKADTDIIPGDTAFALFQGITKKQIYLSDYVNRKYFNQISPESLSSDRRFDLNTIASKNFGSINEFNVAQRIFALDPLSKKLRLYSAHNYTAALFKQDNAILLGGGVSNPWDYLFEDKLNFVMEYDPNTFIPSVRNRTPAAGELVVYSPSYSTTSDVGYAVIAFIPNLDSKGKVLIIEGTGSQAVEAAGDFLMSEDHLADFQKKLHVDKLPYFELLLKTKRLDTTSLSSTIESYRLYPASSH